MTASTAPPFSAAGPATSPAAPLLQPETFTPDQSIMYLLKRVLVGLSQATTRELAMEDSSLPQWLPLFKLWRADAHTVAELARQCSVDVSTMTRMLDRLEKKELLLRQPCPEDRRSVRLRLSPAGQAMNEEAPQIATRAMNELVGCLSTEELHTLTHLLDKILRAHSVAACAPQEN